MLFQWCTVGVPHWRSTKILHLQLPCLFRLPPFANMYLCCCLRFLQREERERETDRTLSCPLSLPLFSLLYVLHPLEKTRLVLVLHKEISLSLASTFAPMKRDWASCPAN